MTLEITEELIARQTPEAQAIIRTLLPGLAELEARLNQTPRHSSLPPSSEHPHAKPRRDLRRQRRNSGGQPGHSKHQRPLIPPEQCTDIHEPNRRVAAVVDRDWQAQTLNRCGIRSGNCP